MLLIPAIDLKDGQCVRLKQGDMAQTTVFSDNPVEMAAQWVEQGTQRLHLVDLNGAFDGKPVNRDIINQIATNHPSLSIQIGGGIRDQATVEAYLDAGVQYCIIGTKAVEDPDFVAQLSRNFAGHIIVGIDAKNGMVATDGWAEVSSVTAIDLAQQFEDAGVSAIIYTDIARDGMMSGVNVEATRDLARSINIPVIASGGVKDLDDIKALMPYGNDGVAGSILGRSIYEGTIVLEDAFALVEQAS